ncbi:MAG: PIN domain-containing protein [Minisyncoccota bacterium]
MSVTISVRANAMKEKEASLSIPERSFVLLDTNILVDSSKHPKEFGVLYAELKKLDITLVTESTIRFEFLRGLYRDLEAGKQLLTELCGPDHAVLFPDAGIFDRALTISRIYMNADNKSASVPDTLIAAQMCKYARDTQSAAEMFLATQNHRDFPPVLFECTDDILITLADGSIKVVGFYRFRKDRFKALSSK